MFIFILLMMRSKLLGIIKKEEKKKETHPTPVFNSKNERQEKYNIYRWGGNCLKTLEIWAIQNKCIPHSRHAL